MLSKILNRNRNLHKSFKLNWIIVILIFLIFLYIKNKGSKSVNLVINPELNGPVTANEIPGWKTRSTAIISIVNWDKRNNVLKIKDNGSYSEVYQSIKTDIGVEYEISYDVWATLIGNTKDEPACSTVDSNGLMAITFRNIDQDTALSEVTCDGDVCFGGSGSELVDHFLVCPTVEGRWTTVTGTFIMPVGYNAITVRLHGELTYDVYFDSVSIRVKT